MLSKIFVVFCIIIPFIEYYNFIAVRKAVQNRGLYFRKLVLISNFVLSISTLAALYIYPRMTTTAWPSIYFKILISVLIAAFFGKFLVSGIMFAGDILLFLKALVLKATKLFKNNKTEVSGKSKSNAESPLITRSEFISKGALLCGAAFTIGLSYGMTNRYRYKLRYVQVPLPGIPDELRGFRIIQISDIHTGSFDNMEAVLNGINMVLEARPHIILFTGDLVNYRASEVVPYLDIFSKLTAPLGVYSILGNHDYSDYISWNTEEEKKADFEQLLGYERELGWQLLMNSNSILQWKGKRFALIGSENWSIKSRFKKYGDLGKAMTGLNEANLPLKILMSHDPSHWDAQIRPQYPDIDLTLSGHTHGMQMGIESKNFHWSPASFLYKQWAGLYKEGRQYLYVNRGFGFIGYNGRLGILPEITLLELV